MKWLNIVYVVLIAGLTGALIYVKTSVPKTGFVSTPELYNEFSLTKELQSKLGNVKQMRQQVLDSIKIELQVIGNRLQQVKIKNDSLVSKFEMLRQKYVMKERQFSEENQLLEQEHSDQVWKQLNQYVNDYGDKNGFAYIYGASGNGSLMHADKGLNLTDELIKYVNERYKGGRQ